jgi:integration host factor subunit alpha
MTKADIISEVFDKVGLPKQDAEEMVEMILDTIKQTLKAGETVKLSGFGNFVVRKKNSRKGRNPKTGQEIEITPRSVVSFFTGSAKSAESPVWNRMFSGTGRPNSLSFGRRRENRVNGFIKKRILKIFSG